jgi:PilZ domain
VKTRFRGTVTLDGEKVGIISASVALQQIEEQIVSLADAMEGTERRSRVRAKVNFLACVRSEQFGDDIVPCIDMSRSGISFHSKNAYQKNGQLQVAVPFSPGAKDAPAIFVKGRTANVKKLSDGLWRCGVEFLRE